MNILNRFIGLNKPLAGARLNWGHPLAPVHPRACVLPLNEPMEAIRDAANKRTFSRVVSATESNWVASGLPVANGLGFRLFATSSSVFTKFTAPGAVDETTMSGSKYITLACIYLSLGTTGGGPRPIGNGDNRSLILEPGFNGASTAYVLAGNVAHVDTGLPWTAGNWGFFGVSSSGNQFTVNRMRAVVNDYRTNTIRTAANDSFSGIAPTSGTGSLMCLGATDTTNVTASNGILYWALIDYAEWSIDRMIELSLNPFGMFTDIANRAYFIGGSSDFSWAVSDSASGTDTAASAASWGVADAGSGAESGSSASAWSATDAGSGADAVVVAWAYAVSDSGSGSESIGFGSLLSWAVSDSGSGSDSLALAAALVVTDTAAGSETVAGASAWAVSDSGSGSESVGFGSLLAWAVSDSASGSDVVSSASTWSIADSASGSETAARAAALVVADSAAGVETVAGGEGFTLVVLVTTLTATTIRPLAGLPDPSWTTVTPL